MSNRWKIFLIAAFLLGCILRLIWVGDMEYKLDEEYMFQRWLNLGYSETWNWLGMPSGVSVRNPGMSVWVFYLLGWLSHAQVPTDLCMAVRWLNIAALLLLGCFIYIYIHKNSTENKITEPWLWAFTFAAINPLAVMYQRKIWAQSVLPFFCVLFLMTWWKRHKHGSAFSWGLIGAIMGQIHMSGFFFALAFLIWTVFFERTLGPVEKRFKWKAWFFGSIIGLLPLIPWVYHNFTQPAAASKIYGGIGPLLELRYWMFWLSDAFGLHMGHSLGVGLSNSILIQNSDFFRYPPINNQPTYIMAAIHLIIVILLAFLLITGTYHIEKRIKSWAKILIGSEYNSHFAQNAAAFGYGSILMLSTITVRRYYLIITYPFEWLWLARTALIHGTRGRKILVALWLCQLAITCCFLHYIHKNHGAPNGDYGIAYQYQNKR